MLLCRCLPQRIYDRNTIVSTGFKNSSAILAANNALIDYEIDGIAARAMALVFFAFGHR
jgi:hypothetical protein